MQVLCDCGRAMILGPSTVKERLPSPRPGPLFGEDEWHPGEAQVEITIDTLSGVRQEYFRLECPACGQLLMRIRGCPILSEEESSHQRAERAPTSTYIKDVRDEPL